ncbi:uroporphyrin-III C-methyltransferase, partial [Geobacillus stearothermophilus]|nr:uroporphyrin-III C-methyltransferase [Geobacillus stearothermophilus]
PAARPARAPTARPRPLAATLSPLSDEVEQAGLSPPAIIIIGDVVRLRETLQWFPERQGGVVDADASS